MSGYRLKGTRKQKRDEVCWVCKKKPSMEPGDLCKGCDRSSAAAIERAWRAWIKERKAWALAWRRARGLP